MPFAERVEQESEPDEPEREPDVRRRVEAATERNAVEQGHPDRNAADQQGCDPGGNRLLRPRERAVPEQEEQPAEDEACAHLLPADRVVGALAARKCDREQGDSRNEVPSGHGQIGRQIAYSDRKGDERRSPDDVDRHQREPDPRVPTHRHAAKDAARRTISSSRVRRSVDQNS